MFIIFEYTARSIHAVERSAWSLFILQVKTLMLILNTCWPGLPHLFSSQNTTLLSQKGPGERERERQRDRETETETETERQKQTERQRQETERQKQRQKGCGDHTHKGTAADFVTVGKW